MGSVTSLARIGFLLIILVSQMLFLFKEMKESVKNEVVPHPPILMHDGEGEGGGHSGPILAFRLSNRTGGADLGGRGGGPDSMGVYLPHILR